MDETELVAAAKQGDIDAYNDLVLLLQDPAYRYALSIMRDPQTAEDCTQEAFLRAYLHLKEYRGQSFRGWFLRILRNVCFDELRRNKRRPIVSSIVNNQDGDEQDLLDLAVDPVLSVEEQVEQMELQGLIFSHLDHLPEKYRSVIYLVDVLELDYSEAASAMGIPIGTVKSRLARSRLYLAKVLVRNGQLLEDLELGLQTWSKYIPAN